MKCRDSSNAYMSAWSLNSNFAFGSFSLSVHAGVRTKLILRAMRLHSLSAHSQPLILIMTRLSQSAELTLALLVLRILANYSDTTFSFDDFALLANGFYRWSYFHRKNPPFTSCVFFCLPTTGFWSGNLKKTRHFLFPIFTKTTEMRTKNRRNDPVKIILEYSSISISKLQEFFWKFQKRQIRNEPVLYNHIYFPIYLSR